MFLTRSEAFSANAIFSSSSSMNLSTYSATSPGSVECLTYLCSSVTGFEGVQ